MFQFTNLGILNDFVWKKIAIPCKLKDWSMVRQNLETERCSTIVDFVRDASDVKTKSTVLHPGKPTYVKCP